MNITIESKYGKVVGVAIERFCVKVHIEGEEKRGFYVINKRVTIFYYIKIFIQIWMIF